MGEQSLEENRGLQQGTRYGSTEVRKYGSTDHTEDSYGRASRKGEVRGGGHWGRRGRWSHTPYRGVPRLLYFRSRGGWWVRSFSR